MDHTVPLQEKGLSYKKTLLLYSAMSKIYIYLKNGTKIKVKVFQRARITAKSN